MPRGVCHQTVLVVESAFEPFGHTCPMPWSRCVTHRQSCKKWRYQLTQSLRFHSISLPVAQQWLYRYVVLVVIIVIVDAIPNIVIKHTPLTKCFLNWVSMFRIFFLNIERLKSRQGWWTFQCDDIFWGREQNNVTLCLLDHWWSLGIMSISMC